MNETAPLIFVCVTGRQSTIDWTAVHPRFQVLYTTIPDVVLASVRRTNGPGTRDINAVIFDRSLGPRDFLEFLSEVACEFRGDVLLINGDGGGILSTVSARDGRYIYRLDREDLVFYAAARFGHEDSRAEADPSAYQQAMSA